MNKILDDLIFKGKELQNSIKIRDWNRGLITTYESVKEQEYQNWLSNIKRLIKTRYPSELEDFKKINTKISPEIHIKILGLLNSLKTLPEEPIKDNGNESKISITNNQTQNNSQEINLNIFNEAIKDEITGKQLKELKEILAGFKEDPEKTKSTLLEKIKGFGSDVLSNIVANIVTNPTIYNSL
ncbi:hypothetical protein ACILE9_04070 [Capnocytophaga cynodegmi]|uniref:hypothetical protein n=1 Tax=Capnocytophaga cynodegmi TaxID=28189 RepID=UPI0037D0C5FC